MNVTHSAFVWAGAVALCALLSCETSSQARADEQELAVKDLPKPVLEAAKAKFPGAVFTGASKETEDGKTVFEVSMTQQNRKMDVTFTANGTLDLVETEVPAAEVPAAVTQPIKAKYPGAKIDLVESVKKGPELKKDADYYEFHLTTADKKSVEVEVDAKGKIMKTEEGGDEKN